MMSAVVLYLARSSLPESVAKTSGSGQDAGHKEVVVGLVIRMTHRRPKRRRVGDPVDRFTASVFLGSGLVLTALAAVGISLLTAPPIVLDPASSLAAEPYTVTNAVRRCTPPRLSQRQPLAA